MQILEVKPLLLNVADVRLRVTPAEFDRLCRLNPDLRLEVNRDGELIVMPPTGGDTGTRNFTLIGKFASWVEQNGTGKGYDSSTGYNLAAVGGKNPSPDVSWIEKSRLEGVDTSGLMPVVPDFVIELRSKTDPFKGGSSQDGRVPASRSAPGLANKPPRSNSRNLPPTERCGNSRRSRNPQR